MASYEILDISGDAGIKAFGNDLKELFHNAAVGMYSLITDIGGIKEARKIDVSVRSGSMEGLLVAWLNELVFHFDTYGFLGKRITIDDFPPDKKDQEAGQEFKMSASLSGEDFDRERHEGKLLIKAATYHGLEIEKKDGIWQAEIIFDI
jgi:SHS2 domain-containing protein